MHATNEPPLSFLNERFFVVVMLFQPIPVALSSVLFTLIVNFQVIHLPGTPAGSQKVALSLALFPLPPIPRNVLRMIRRRIIINSGHEGGEIGAEVGGDGVSGIRAFNGV